MNCRSKDFFFWGGLGWMHDACIHAVGVAVESQSVNEVAPHWS